MSRAPRNRFQTRILSVFRCVNANYSNIYGSRTLATENTQQMCRRGARQADCPRRLQTLCREARHGFLIHEFAQRTLSEPFARHLCWRMRMQGFSCDAPRRHRGRLRWKASNRRCCESYQDSIKRLRMPVLVGREVQISCRRTGHALFRLPSAHALAVVTVSDATCSECGLPVADEKVEDVFAPTRLASSASERGSWLMSRLHYLFAGEQGIPRE